MKSFELIEAVVKFETLVKGIGWWISENLDYNALRWLNAWLGPHWILALQGDGIVIYREGGIAYQGRFRDFPDSDAALNHQVELKMLDDGSGFAAYLYEMALDLAQTLQGWIAISLPSTEIQRRVQTFFEFHKTKAAQWLSE